MYQIRDVPLPELDGNIGLMVKQWVSPVMRIRLFDECVYSC